MDGLCRRQHGVIESIDRNDDDQYATELGLASFECPVAVFLLFRVPVALEQHPSVVSALGELLPDQNIPV